MTNMEWVRKATRHLWVVFLMGVSTPAHASLLDAVENRDHAALTLLLQRGASLEEQNETGQTALLVAVWKNDVRAARALIEAGADVNRKDDISDSPFLVAGAQGRTEILDIILMHGADLASTNRYGVTALIPAAEKGHPETVDMLIAAGVDIDHVNNLGWTALLEVTILRGDDDVSQRIVRSLLSAGADVTVRDPKGKTALDNARARGLKNLVSILEARSEGSRTPTMRH